MELIVIRHGLPAAAAGDLDPPLSTVGRRQAAAMAARLRTEPIDAVYVSPLRRARQTAAPLEAALGHTAVVHDGLAEWDRDADAYVPLEELRAAGDERWAAMVAGDLAALGVDVGAFRSRVRDAVDVIVATHPGERVAVVCHGGVINAVTADVLGLDRLLWFEPAYASITRVLAGRGGRRALRTVNDAAHLETPGPRR